MVKYKNTIGDTIMKFEHVADKVSGLRNDRNFSLFMLGLTGGLSAVGLATGIGAPAILTAVAAGVYATTASVRHYKLQQWTNAQNLIEDSAPTNDIHHALEQAAGPTKKTAFVSTLPNLDAPSPRPVRTTQVEHQTVERAQSTVGSASAPKM